MPKRSMLTTSILSAVVSLASVIGLEGLAAAEPVKKEGDMDIMNFVDADKLVTSGNTASGMTITPGHHPVRILLVRPRLHFVPELIKTIENL
jgi:hypothetical protein